MTNSNRVMTFDESYGAMPHATLYLIKRVNLSPADWDMMLTRWGFSWGDENLPWTDIENFISIHSQTGSYIYPMYGD